MDNGLKRINFTASSMNSTCSNAPWSKTKSPCWLRHAITTEPCFTMALICSLVQRCMTSPVLPTMVWPLMERLHPIMEPVVKGLIWPWDNLKSREILSEKNPKRQLPYQFGSIFRPTGLLCCYVVTVVEEMWYYVLSMRYFPVSEKYTGEKNPSSSDY